MTVKCPNCEWSAEVPDEKIPAGGGKGTCPKCQTKFEVHKDATPLTEEPPVLSSPTQRDTRACPLCGEEILSVAKKCKHCQSMLYDTLEPPINSEPIVACTQCGSTQFTAAKQGFGFGLATVGGLLVGPLGLLAGLKGIDTTTITCLKCGHQWTPVLNNDAMNEQSFKEQQEQEERIREHKEKEEKEWREYKAKRSGWFL